MFGRQTTRRGGESWLFAIIWAIRGRSCGGLSTGMVGRTVRDALDFQRVFVIDPSLRVSSVAMARRTRPAGQKSQGPQAR